MNRGRVLALVTDGFGGRGGIAQYNRDFYSALAASGWAVRIVPRLSPDRVGLPEGVTQSKPVFGRLAYSFNAIRAGLADRPEIVLCGHIYMAPLAWLVARLVGAKLVLQTHGVEAWPAQRGIARAAVEAADFVLTVSRYTRGKILEWYAMAPERIVVIANTVGEAFRPGDAGDLRARWGLEGKRVLLTVARMDPGQRYKGQDLVIRTLPELVRNGYDVVYVAGGAGGDRARLEQLAATLGVADRVRFVGAVPQSELPACYRMADLFVMPSTGEGFGIVYLEAMACGTPALGLASTGSLDALVDGELGTATTAQDLAAAIARCLDRPKPDAEMLSAQVRTRFGRHVFAARVASVFREFAGAA